MKFLLSIFVCAAAVAASSAMICSPGSCDNFECEPVEDCKGRLEPNGGFCGCCETCIAQLDEGDVCPRILFGAPDYSECTDGLYCDQEKLLCTKIGACKAEYDSKKDLEPMPGMVLPDCEDDGTYKPKQCLGSVCYCVSAEGEEIGGTTNIWEADDVTCECARERHDVMSGTPAMGTFVPQCDISGDYQTIQCHGSVCYCVDSSYGKQLYGSEKHISEYGNMEC